MHKNKHQTNTNILRKSCSAILFSIFLVGSLSQASCNQQDQSDSTNSSASPEQKTVSSLTAQTMRDAALNGNIQQVRQAIQEGVDVNKADQAGRTALMLASFNGHKEIAELLLEEGANIDDKNADGRTALIFAASGPFPDTVKLLLENDANPDTKDAVDGWSALMFASAEGQKEVVQVLLDGNADPTLKDKEGDTAIDFARNNDHTEVIRLLEEQAN